MESKKQLETALITAIQALTDITELQDYCDNLGDARYIAETTLASIAINHTNHGVC